MNRGGCEEVQAYYNSVLSIAQQLEFCDLTISLQNKAFYDIASQ